MTDITVQCFGALATGAAMIATVLGMQLHQRRASARRRRG